MADVKINISLVCALCTDMPDRLSNPAFRLLFICLARGDISRDDWCDATSGGLGRFAGRHLRELIDDGWLESTDEGWNLTDKAWGVIL